VNHSHSKVSRRQGRQTSRVRFFVIISLPIALAIALHFAQVFTGPLNIPQRYREYGARGFTTGAETYPRTATDSEGYTIKLTRPVQRVASQYWSIDEFLYSVARPESVVAVSQTAYERDFSNVFQWADMFRPAVAANPEVILKLDPDLLLISSFARADFSGLVRGAGIPVFRMHTSFTKLEEIRRAIVLTGYLTGRDSEAARVARAFDEAVVRARSRKPPGAAPPRILGFSGGYTYGSETLFDDIVRCFGGVNIAAEKGLRSYDPISAEQILRWNPDWIVSSAPRGQSEAVLKRLLSDPSIAPTAAARKGQIVVLENHIFLPMSPFTTLILEALGDALYS